MRLCTTALCREHLCVSSSVCGGDAHVAAYRPLEQDEGANIALYNEELQTLIESGKKTWFQMPWLFAECYLCGALPLHPANRLRIV